MERLLHRVPEALYDFAADPHALHNLAANPRWRAERERLRGELLAWMERTGDPLLEKFRPLAITNH